MFNSVRSHISPFFQTCSKTVEPLKQGLLPIGEKGSRIVYAICSMNGFVPLSKFMLATLRILPHTRFGNMFKDMEKTVGQQKDLYYATLFVPAAVEYIDQRVDGTYAFKWAGGADKVSRFIKSFQLIGHVCETGNSLMKYASVKFPPFTAIGNYCAPIQFNFFGTVKKVDDIPIISALFIKPKEFFIFIASFTDVGRTLAPVSGRQPWHERFVARFKSLDMITNLKLIGNIGRMFLIWTNRYHNETFMFASVDLLTQSASLLRFVLEHEKQRNARLGLL